MFLPLPPDFFFFGAGLHQIGIGEELLVNEEEETQ